MPEGGRLSVSFVRNDGRFPVAFSDTGKGIEPELVDHVFEPFFTTKREGIGLGLFFSKAIVEKHGGTITIGPSTRRRAPPSLSPFRWAEYKSSYEQASVLVVEDNDLERQITVDTLRDEGFRSSRRRSATSDGAAGP